MVRSSLGRSVLLDSGGLAEDYPFCAISVPDFLEMTEWQPHQDLKASGKVREMSDKAEVLFCSHQWCSFTHPVAHGARNSPRVTGRLPHRTQTVTSSARCRHRSGT